MTGLFTTKDVANARHHVLVDGVYSSTQMKIDGSVDDSCFKIEGGDGMASTEGIAL